MSEDKEIEAINQKKLKAKGAKIVEKEEKVNLEGIIINLSQYLNDRGLEMMNVSTDLRKMIGDIRQKANEKINTPDNEKE
jgi:hypothetical protein